jgi:hypothetical protein
MIAKDFTLQISVLTKDRTWIESHERMTRYFIMMDHYMKKEKGMYTHLCIHSYLHICRFIYLFTYMKNIEIIGRNSVQNIDYIHLYFRLCWWSCTAKW